MMVAYGFAIILIMQYKGSSMRHNSRLRRKHVFEALELRQLLSAYYVDANAPGLTQDGSSWESAVKDLQTLLTSPTLLSGDTIKVADGTYKPTSTADRTQSFNLVNGVGIYGGYAGYGATNPDARDIALYPTILSGDIWTIGDIADNSYHVVIANSVSAATLLDGMTITQGNTKGLSDDQSNGGGLLCISASPTLSHCAFSQNYANQGGAIYMTFSQPSLSFCTLTGNDSSSGSIYAYYSTFTMDHCTSTGNTRGGGLFNNYSSPNINNCVFSINQSSGIYNYNYSSPKLANCMFFGNTATKGGGINNYYYSSPILINCLFSGNTASYGGGICNNYYSSTNLTNCTFSGNTASKAPGIYNYYTTSSILTNCILWNNGSYPISDDDQNISTLSYCDIQGGHSGTGNINADPQFIRSPWAGPDGVCGTPDDDYGDLSLRLDSPCLNYGLNSANSTSTDLAGNARIQNSVIDIGAYEGSFTAPAPKTLYVDQGAPRNSTGSSWTNAFTDLQSAILASTDGDAIKIADGTYKPTSTSDRTISFVLKNAVSIYGGYAGFGAADPDARNTSLYPTILSGDIGTLGNSDDNSYHVLIAASTYLSTVLDGVTITLGCADGTGVNQNFGGGLLSVSASPTLTNCIFSGNSAIRDGGGIYYSKNSSSTLTNCIFTGNSAIRDGGGIYSSSSPTLTNCTFTNNTATNGSAIFDGASISLILTNSILWNNGSKPVYICYNTAATITYNDIQGGYSGTGNLNADPLFVRNPSPGADSKWGTADDDYGDLRLQLASPCINKGHNPANTSATDLAGNPRIINSIIDMGAYETTLPIALAGASENDTYVAKRSADGLSLQIWTSADTSTAPAYSYPLNTLSAVALNLSDGADTLLLDLSNGANLPLSLANIENIQILSTSTTSLALSSTQITLNSTLIPYTGTPTFLLNSNILNSLSLSGNISLKLANPNLIVNSGAVPSLRAYLANAATGAKPSILCDTASTLALLDNSKLHKTSFAGVTLSAPFSQLLIRPATPGDANLDGIVNQNDLLSLFANLKKPNATWLNGDVDQSGTVDLSDLAIVQSHLAAPANLVLKTVQPKSKSKTTPKTLHKLKIHKPK